MFKNTPNVLFAVVNCIGEGAIPQRCYIHSRWNHASLSKSISYILLRSDRLFRDGENLGTALF
ncbi:MAG: hypothetical protein HEQ19_31130 [Gloeotrichia echinulata CP02]